MNPATRNDNAGRQPSEVGKANNRQADHNGTAVDFQSLCLCHAGKTCGWCHLHNRIAEFIHDSLRRQALGNLTEDH